jgi:hypothetical protein
MKRTRTTRIYASVPKLRIRAFKKIRNIEENTSEYNNAENITSYKDTLERTEGVNFHPGHNVVPSHGNTLENLNTLEHKEDSIISNFEEDLSGLTIVRCHELTK